METILPAIAGYLILAVVLLWVSRAGASGNLDPNGVVGIRTSATQKSPEAWKVAHKAYIPYAIATAVTGAVFILALLIMFFVADAEPYLGATAVVGYGVILAVVIAGGIKSHRTAEAYNRETA